MYISLSALNYKSFSWHVDCPSDRSVSVVTGCATGDRGFIPGKCNDVSLRHPSGEAKNPWRYLHLPKHLNCGGKFTFFLSLQKTFKLFVFKPAHITNTVAFHGKGHSMTSIKVNYSFLRFRSRIHHCCEPLHCVAVWHVTYHTMLGGASPVKWSSGCPTPGIRGLLMTLYLCRLAYKDNHVRKHSKDRWEGAVASFKALSSWRDCEKTRKTLVTIIFYGQFRIFRL